MKVLVIGAGPAGMMAAITAANLGDEVTVLERNDKVGMKLYITGKGRCNITNDCDNREFIASVISNPKFLMSAISKFSTADTVEMCKENGLNVKVERGGRVFPESDKANDVIRMFERMMWNAHVKVMFNARVDNIIAVNGIITSVKVGSEIIPCDKVIIATGGKSYPATGSTGDGYEFARRLGHNVTPILPALVGINFPENSVTDLAGLSLKNVSASVVRDGKVIASEFGEMLFTHTGVSGPIILSLSSRINKAQGKLSMVLDLKPSLSEETLSARLLRDFDANQNKEFRNAIGDLTVRALIPIIIEKSAIDQYKKVHQVTREERERLVKCIKNLTYDIKDLCGVASAIVTSGGVDVREISPRNMQSKLVSGLHFCGEVLDVDAVTGGFNIQIALSTGMLAGSHN